MDIVSEARKLASENLRACYGDLGILAGKGHFNDYWARDSFFASFGALMISDNDIVKRNLQLFLRNMSKNGQVPLRIGKTTVGIVLRYLSGINTRRRAFYSNDKSKSVPVDQNSLLIIAMWNYVKNTKDVAFALQNKTLLEKAFSWSMDQDKDGDMLIEEGAFCNWADSIKKRGKVLYSNVLHCHAAECLYLLTKEKSYLDIHHKVKRRINDRFWSGEHYIDWIDGEETYNYFSTDGNLLAILWDIADSPKARHIEEAAHIFDIHDIPSSCVHPEYRPELISMQTKLIGLGDYHNGLSWLWLGALNVAVKAKLGSMKEARHLAEKMSSLIIKHNGVHEVYEKTGMPVRRPIYHAEYPFAWSSGMFLWALNSLQ